MKILFIFRGLNERIRNDVNHSALNCVNNWNKTLFEPLRENDIEYDISLVTYNSGILEKLKEILKPIDIITEGHNNQISVLKNVANLINKRRNEYTRFIIMRFDYMYKYKITEWPKWKENGFFINNKDVHWPTLKFYSDILFIVDDIQINNFIKCISLMSRNDGHTIGTYFYENNLPIILIFDLYYHQMCNPLFSYEGSEPEPDLNDPTKNVIIVTDVSRWNS